MKTNFIESITLPIKASLMDALKGLEVCGKNVQCILDEQRRMVGLLTDGDIRRGLISGLSINAPVSKVLTKSFHYVAKNADRNAVLDIMKAMNIRQIPVLDDDSRLIGIHFIDDFLNDRKLPNIAVIMAGGKGVRMRPLTEYTPKPMLKVAGRPIIERLVLKLVGNGITNIYIAINYLGWVIKEHFGDGSRFGCNITYLEEEKELGTGGALNLLPADINSPILVLNGDLVTGADFSDILHFHRQKRCEATIVAKHYTHAVPYGTLEFKDHQLISIREKPNMSCFINTGIYVLNPTLLKLVHPKGVLFPMTRIFESCLDQKTSISVYHLEEEWRDLGDIKEFHTACGSLIDR